MASIDFTSHLQRYVKVHPVAVDATTVAEALTGVFNHFPALKGYVLDDQGCVRQHVMIFVDGQTISDRRRQTDKVDTNSEIFIAQSLSGG